MPYVLQPGQEMKKGTSQTQRPVSLQRTEATASPPPGAASVPDKTIGQRNLWPYDDPYREGDNRLKNCWPRRLGSIILLFLFASAALGVDGSSTPGAVLQAAGKVQVNGADSRKITTLFSGDSIKTDPDSVASIIATGSSVLVMPNASVKFLGNAVELTQGGWRSLPQWGCSRWPSV
jgi:hypothetical protein